jgi:hypothetical protein
MNTQVSSKFAALAVALMLNAVLVGATMYLFSTRFQHTAEVGAGDCPKALTVFGAL